MAPRKNQYPWLRREAYELDMEARAYQARHHVEPLRPDPKLRELLGAPVRGGAEVNRKKTIPERCALCGSLMRRGKESPVQFPGTVRHSGNGVCDSCATRRRLGLPPKGSGDSGQ